jgi:hypothetical protein
MCGNADQTAHYHTLGPKLGTSFMIWHLGGLSSKCRFLNVNEASENKSELLQIDRRKFKEEWCKKLNMAYI